MPGRLAHGLLLSLLLLRCSGAWVCTTRGTAATQGRCGRIRAAVSSSGPSQSQQQSASVSGALESLLPGYLAKGMVSENNAAAANAPPAAPLDGSLQALLDSGDAAAMARREELMEESYEACRLITKQYAKTFYFGTKFFSMEKRRAVWAIYAWCRRTDDIVDKPRKENVSLRSELAEWGRRLTEVWAGRAHDLIDLALVDTVCKYPDLSVEPFEDMVKVCSPAHVLYCPSNCHLAQQHRGPPPSRIARLLRVGHGYGSRPEPLRNLRGALRVLLPRRRHGWTDDDASDGHGKGLDL